VPELRRLAAQGVRRRGRDVQRLRVLSDRLPRVEDGVVVGVVVDRLVVVRLVVVRLVVVLLLVLVILVLIVGLVLVGLRRVGRTVTPAPPLP
jgi:hypothetical protein